ncbi:MAG TPA: hypothetical protein VFZ91_06350 [Allosphingosinicella sp.]
MGIRPIKVPPLTQARLSRLLDPSLVFYRVAVRDTIERGELADIQVLLKGAKEAKAEFGDFDGLIKQLEAAAKRAK